MEVNETIQELKLDLEKDQLARLSDEGRQAMADILGFCRRNRAVEVGSPITGHVLQRLTQWNLV